MPPLEALLTSAIPCAPAWGPLLPKRFRLPRHQALLHCAESTLAAALRRAMMHTISEALLLVDTASQCSRMEPSAFSPQLLSSWHPSSHHALLRGVSPIFFGRSLPTTFDLLDLDFSLLSLLYDSLLTFPRRNHSPLSGPPLYHSRLPRSLCPRFVHTISSTPLVPACRSLTGHRFLCSTASA